LLNLSWYYYLVLVLEKVQEELALVEELDWEEDLYPLAEVTALVEALELAQDQGLELRLIHRLFDQLAQDWENLVLFAQAMAQDLG
jgi:hypothetical protein